MFFSACSALAILAALAVPTAATAATAEEPAASGDARIPAAAKRLAAAYESGGGVTSATGAESGAASGSESAEGSVTGAELRTNGDATGDVPFCGGDLTSIRMNYGTSLIDVSATTACSVDPVTSTNWKVGATAIGWFFNHDNNETLDYLAIFLNDGDGNLIYGVIRLADEVVTCDGAGSWDGNRTYGASFAPNCIGSPSLTYLGVLMSWDETSNPDTCQCPEDFAPETEMLGPIWRGTPPLPGAGGSGYWMVGQTGIVYAFGDARHYGNADVTPFGPGVTATDIESRPNDNAGYWILDSAGHVYAFGSASWFGNAGLAAGERATSIAGTKTGKGYYVFTDRGRAIKFGDAVFRGDMSGTPLNGPVLDSTLSGAGDGYYMVGSDGGIFSFNAKFHGSMGGQPLNAPVNGMAGDPDNVGYWLVASDGGIFAFKAPFKGSMGGAPLNRPVIGMVAYGDGYLMVSSDGGIFKFSSKAFRGSLGGNPPAVPIASVAPIR